MKGKSLTKGTSAYIVGEVKRFDQKNEMFKRSVWDPQFQDIGTKFFGRPKYPKNKDGFNLEDLAFSAAGWYIERAFARGNIIHNTGMYSWDPIPDATKVIPPGSKLRVDDTKRMSKHIKKVAEFFGASSVGITTTDERWVYSHSFNYTNGEHSEFELPKECKYTIVIVLEMDYELARNSPTWLAWVTAGKGYSMMAVTATMLAQFIRGLGYKAIPSGNDSAISIPLAIDAGLGELGRNGMLITPKYGPRVRLAKVFTDLPLHPDEPIQFGVLDFCSKCRKCAKYCPSQSITYGARTTQPHNVCNSSGALKWPINAETCFAFWARNDGSCMNCISVCPFNKPKGWLHDVARWMVKHAPWLNFLLIRLDDFFSYGKRMRASKYWD